MTDTKYNEEISPIIPLMILSVYALFCMILKGAFGFNWNTYILMFCAGAFIYAVIIAVQDIHFNNWRKKLIE